MALSLGNTGAQILLTTTTNPLLTTGTGQNFLFLKVNAANTDASAHTVTAYMVPAGGSVATSNIVLEPFNVAANSNAVLPLSGQTISNGAAIYMKCSTTGVMNASIAYASI